jgi:hypothetical protein
VPTALRCLLRRWNRPSGAVAVAAAQKRECNLHAATSGRPSVRNFPPPVHIQCRRSQIPHLPVLVLALPLPTRAPRRAVPGAEAALAAELVAVRVVLASAAVRLQSMPRMRLDPRRPFAALIRHHPGTFSTVAAVRRPRPRRNRGARLTIVPTPLPLLRPRRRPRQL